MMKTQHLIPLFFLCLTSQTLGSNRIDCLVALRSQIDSSSQSRTLLGWNLARIGALDEAERIVLLDQESIKLTTGVAIARGLSGNSESAATLLARHYINDKIRFDCVLAMLRHEKPWLPIEEVAFERLFASEYTKSDLSLAFSLHRAARHRPGGNPDDQRILEILDRHLQERSLIPSLTPEVLVFLATRDPKRYVVAVEKLGGRLDTSTLEESVHQLLLAGHWKFAIVLLDRCEINFAMPPGAASREVFNYLSALSQVQLQPVIEEWLNAEGPQFESRKGDTIVLTSLFSLPEETLRTFGATKGISDLTKVSAFCRCAEIQLLKERSSNANTYLRFASNLADNAGKNDEDLWLESYLILARLWYPIQRDQSSHWLDQSMQVANRINDGKLHSGLHTGVQALISIMETMMEIGDEEKFAVTWKLLESQLVSPKAPNVSLYGSFMAAGSGRQVISLIRRRHGSETALKWIFSCQNDDLKRSLLLSFAEEAGREAESLTSVATILLQISDDTDRHRFAEILLTAFIDSHPEVIIYPLPNYF